MDKLYKNMMLYSESKNYSKPLPIDYGFLEATDFRNKINTVTSAEEALQIVRRYCIPYNCITGRLIEEWTIVKDATDRTIFTDNVGFRLVMDKNDSVILESLKQPKASNMSDEELVMELIKRGYTVGKADK